MERGTCATCTFFEDVKNQCRYNPPTVQLNPNAAGAHIVSLWPRVDFDDWCSHWKSALVHGQRKTWDRQLNEQANNKN